VTRWFKGPEARLDLTGHAPAAQKQGGAERVRPGIFDHQHRTAAPHILATRLAGACTWALGVDSAAISIVGDGVAAPLGASDAAGRRAARLQFDQGQGPALDAAHLGRIAAADRAELARRWPAFATDLAAQTPFQGVISMPLVFDQHTRGALDLFVCDPGRLSSVGLAHALAISEAVAAALRTGLP
jgi:GAF domain-containing protein